MSELRRSTVRTAAGDTLFLHGGRIKVRSRGDSVAVAGGLDTDDDAGAKRVFALPTGMWASVSDDDYADVPAFRLIRKFA